TLSGVALYIGNSEGICSGSCARWNTAADDGKVYNVYLFTGLVSSPFFLNSGNTDTSLDPNLALPLGIHVLQFAGSSTPDGYLGLNLYFDHVVNSNRITAVVPIDGSHNFSAVPEGADTIGQGGVQPSSGTLSCRIGD